MSETPRVLYACNRCGEAFGEGEDDNGKCPHCRRGRGEPIGEFDDSCDEPEPIDGHCLECGAASDEECDPECESQFEDAEETLP